MTDLEIQRACASVLGINEVSRFKATDAQCMALVKKFGLCLDSNVIPEKGEWHVSAYHEYGIAEQSTSKDLNRAICECVAKMRAAKCA